MSKLEKFLKESALSPEAKALITEAWNEEKQDLVATIRDEMTTRFEADKQSIVEGLDKMAQLVDWYNTQADLMHPIERAAKVYADFVGIHPFIDGNGRTSRLLMNLELMKAGYPPCVITVENRLAYYEALDQWMASGKTEAFIRLVSEAVQDGFKPYQVVLGI